MILSSILNCLVDHQSGGVTTFNAVSIAGVVGPFHGAVAEEEEIQRVSRFFRGSVAGNYPIALPDTRSHVDVATWDRDNETPAPERPLVRNSVVDDG